MANKSGSEVNCEEGTQRLPVRMLKRIAKKKPPFYYYVAFIALAGYAVCCLGFWVKDVWQPDWDSALYILGGQSLAAGEGYSYLDRPFFLRPPGMSWLISLVLYDGAFDAHTLNLMMMMFVATAIAAIYLAMKPNSRPWTALGVALLFGTSRPVVKNFNLVLSEFLFLTLLFLGMAFLWIAENALTAKKWWISSLLASVSLTGAFYIRTAAILLVPGIPLVGYVCEANRRWRWRIIVPAVVMVGLYMPWFVYVRGAANKAERPSEQLLLFDYTTAIFHVDPGDPDSDLVPVDKWLTRVKNNGHRLLYDLGSMLLDKANMWLGCFLAAGVVAGLGFALCKRPSIMEWFTVVYFVIFLTYFTYDIRLIIPVLPLIYLYLFVAVSQLCAWISKRFNIAEVTSIAGKAIFILFIAVNIAHFSGGPRPSEQYEDLWQQDIYEIAGWVKNNTPADAVLLCRDAPIISLLTERRAYTYRFPRTRNRGLLFKYNPDYVILEYLAGQRPQAERFLASHSSGHWIVPNHRQGHKIAVYKLNKP